VGKKDKKSKEKFEQDEYDEDEPLLIRLGDRARQRFTARRDFDVPVIVAAVKQQGDVDLIVFEDMRVNDTPVTIDDHVTSIQAAEQGAINLSPSVRIFVSTPQAVLKNN
jgi:hypothetical protein